MSTIVNPFRFGKPLSGSGFLTALERTDSGTSDLYDGVGLGPVAANRVIVIATAAYQAAPTGVKIQRAGYADVTLTHILSGSQTGAYGHLSLWWGLVPEEETGDVLVTYGGTVTDAGMACWNVYTTATAVHASGQDAQPDMAGTDVTTSVTVPADGFAVSVCSLVNYPGMQAAWTGLTERFDGGYAGHNWTGASDYYASLQTSKTVSVAEDPTTQGYRQMLTISIGAS